MPGIFISYRRDDTAGHAGRLVDDLIDRFGHDRLLVDIDHLEPGMDFVAALQKARESCEVLLAVIGRQW